MSQYRITATYNSISTTIEPDSAFSYTDCLNEINEAEFRFSSMSKVIRAVIVMGATVEILRDTTREFYGIIDHLDYVDGGGIVAHASGYEIWLAKEHGSYSSSPWTSTASATIFASLIGESTHLSADATIEAGLSVDLKVSPSDSIFNAITTLLKKTGQDYFIDYSNTADIEIGVKDHRGESTSIGTMNGGIDFYNLRYTTTYPAGNYIIVYGKGDGDDQIKSTSAHGQDATSQAAYGTIKRIVVDRTIINEDAANNLADKEVPLTKDPQKVYQFQVKDITWDIEAGDVLTINSEDVGLSDEDVRVIRVKRGYYGSTEFLELQVTNSAYAKVVKDTNRQINELRKAIRDTTTYMQGSGNLSQWEGIRNANNSVGLKIPFYIGSNFEDEAGNLRINSITVDYDVDPFNKEYGSVSESNKSPSIDNSTFCSDDNESTQPLENDSTVASTTLYDSWTTYWDINNVSVHGEAIIFHVHCRVYEWYNTGGSNSLYIRIKHVDEIDYYPSSSGLRILQGYDELTNNTDTDTHSHGPSVSGSRFMYSDACDTWDWCSTATASDSHNHSVTLYAANLQGNCDIYIPIDPYLQDFDVQAQTSDTGNGRASFYMAYYVISQHEHGDGDYKTDSHKHDVSIGDGVSDAGSLNATNVVIYLQKWNTGTSTWDNLVTHTPSPAATLGLNVDMTSSGTYPSTTGWHRIRIITNNASPDLVQATVTIKHNLDN